MKLELIVTGVEETLRALDTIDQGWQREVEGDLDVAGQPLELALSEYAPPRAGSDYQRTFDYLHSIEVHTTIGADGVELEAKQGPEGYWLRGDGNSYQGAWMHRGRWRTLINIIETYVPVVLSRLEARLDSWIRLVTGD